RVALFESVEQLREDRRVDSLASVDDYDANTCVVGVTGLDRNGAVLRREFDAVVDQIPEHLLESGAVAPHYVTLGPQIHFKPCRCLALADIDGRTDDQVQVHVLLVELQLALLDARKVEQV